MPNIKTFLLSSFPVTFPISMTIWFNQERILWSDVDFLGIGNSHENVFWRGKLINGYLLYGFWLPFCFIHYNCSPWTYFQLDTQMQQVERCCLFVDTNKLDNFFYHLNAAFINCHFRISVPQKYIFFYYIALKFLFWV